MFEPQFLDGVSETLSAIHFQMNGQPIRGDFCFCLLIQFEFPKVYERLLRYGDTESARTIMYPELKILIKVNTLFREKLPFPSRNLASTISQAWIFTTRCLLVSLLLP